MSLLLLAFLVVGAPVAYVRSVPPSSRGGWRALVLALPICLLALAGAAMVVLGQILRING